MAAGPVPANFPLTFTVTLLFGQIKRVLHNHQEECDTSTSEQSFRKFHKVSQSGLSHSETHLKLESVSSPSFYRYALGLSLGKGGDGGGV